ncbi:MAG: hypothetical protein GQ574_28685 [Crocinitomix sp.]|nr:hypothetical protein [Crocinitomix sp.]
MRILIALIIISSFCACKKEVPQEPEYDLYFDYLKKAGNLSIRYRAFFQGYDPESISHFGLCWSIENEMPTINDSLKYTEVVGDYNFSAEINHYPFESGVTYNYRAFIEIEGDYIYTEVAQYTIPQIWKLLDTPYLFNYHMSSSSRDYVHVLLGNTSFVSNDGGQSWAQHSYDLLALQNLTCYSESLSYLYGYPGAPNLFKTIDGGATLIPIDIPEHSLLIEELECPTSSAIHTISKNEYMQRSTDGGLTWDTYELDISEGDYPVDIDFLDESNGVIMTFNGAIFTTSNAGLEWDLRGNNEPCHYRGNVAFINLMEIVVSIDNKLYKSYDSGETWGLKLELETDQRIYDLSFADDGSGMAAGLNYAFERTYDNGESWEGEIGNIGGTVRDIKLFSSNFGYLIRSPQGLYKYDYE